MYPNKMFRPQGFEPSNRELMEMLYKVYECVEYLTASQRGEMDDPQSQNHMIGAPFFGRYPFNPYLNPYFFNRGNYDMRGGRENNRGGQGGNSNGGTGGTSEAGSQ